MNRAKILGFLHQMKCSSRIVGTLFADPLNSGFGQIQVSQKKGVGGEFGSSGRHTNDGIFFFFFF